MPISWVTEGEETRKKLKAHPVYGKVWDLFSEECGEGASSQVNENAKLIQEAMELAIEDIGDMQIESMEE